MADPIPPPPGPPPPPAPPARRKALPWVVAGVVVLVVAVVVVLVLVLSGQGDAADARSVEDVADLTVEAAEDVDAEAGIDLLCEAPSDDQVDDLDELIADGREEAGTDDPDLDVEAKDLQGDDEGSFVVAVTSDDDEEGRELTIAVTVETRDGRACIAGLEPLSLE